MKGTYESHQIEPAQRINLASNQCENKMLRSRNVQNQNQKLNINPITKIPNKG